LENTPVIIIKKNTEHDLTSTSFMNIEDVHKNVFCTSDCSNIEEDNDDLTELKLFMQADDNDTFSQSMKILEKRLMRKMKIFQSI